VQPNSSSQQFAGRRFFLGVPELEVNVIYLGIEEGSMSTTQISPISCHHTTIGHFLYHVWCPNQSLLKRVAHVGFSSLCLIGVIFTAYWLYKQYETPSQKSPGVCQDAIDFALNSLKKHPTMTPMQVGRESVICQPMNLQIAILEGLYWKVYFTAFTDALKTYKEQSPWTQQEVLRAADDLMKISYAISLLALEELPLFTEKLKEFNIKITSAQALTQEKFYQSHTFFRCTRTYHYIRGALIWDGISLVYPKNPTPESHAQPFYTEGTLQHTWNQLYNDYCKQVESYVQKRDLEKESKQHAMWIIKDTRENTFYRSPDLRLV
jgi:hypothetical protein